MENKSMTALISCFVRAYHSNYEYRIFNDHLASKVLTREEYKNISLNMSEGIKFFNFNFKGTREEGLRWIIDNQLSPSVLGRSIYTEKMLENAIEIGTTQYLIFASGYDTSAYKNDLSKKISVFEIDRKEMIEDKINRIKRANLDFADISYIKCDFNKEGWINELINSSYDKNKVSFCSLLGISYYLTREKFKDLLNNIAKIISDGSSIVFDYPTFEESKECKINKELAKNVDENMKSKYNIDDIIDILSDCGLLLYEHLDDIEMTKQYFDSYNSINPSNKIMAPKGVNYCLAVKKH